MSELSEKLRGDHNLFLSVGPGEYGTVHIVGKLLPRAIREILSEMQLHDMA